MIFKFFSLLKYFHKRDRQVVAYGPQCYIPSMFFCLVYTCILDLHTQSLFYFVCTSGKDDSHSQADSTTCILRVLCLHFVWTYFDCCFSTFHLLFLFTFFAFGLCFLFHEKLKAATQLFPSSHILNMCESPPKLGGRGAH